LAPSASRKAGGSYLASKPAKPGYGRAAVATGCSVMAPRNARKFFTDQQNLAKQRDFRL
jgi:hypothetical protein